MKIVKHENGNASFQRDKIPFLTLNWGWEGYEYWSILTNPCGFILIELMSNQEPTLVNPEDIIGSHTRMFWQNYNTNIVPGHHITPIRVSRAVTEFDERFWIDILGSTLIHEVRIYLLVILIPVLQSRL